LIFNSNGDEWSTNTTDYAAKMSWKINRTGVLVLEQGGNALLISGGEGNSVIIARG